MDLTYNLQRLNSNFMNTRGMRWVSHQDKVTICNHNTNETKTTTVSEAIRQLLVSKKISLDSKDVEVTVKLDSRGAVKALLLSDNEAGCSTAEPPGYCQCDGDLERMTKKGIEKTEVLNKATTGKGIENDDSAEEMVRWLENDFQKIGTWWRNKPEEKKVEEEVDLDLTLEWDDDKTNEMQETLFPEVIEDTQLPPERISGILKKHTLDNKIQEPESMVMEIDPDREQLIDPDREQLIDPDEQLDSDDDEDDSWKDCWNCKAPVPMAGLYCEDPDALRITFCCDRPCRIKPTNTEIEWCKKSYPYDSWINHGFS